MTLRRTAIILLLSLGSAGCATRPVREVLPHESQVLEPALIENVLRRAPVRADEEFHAETLLVGQELSIHLVQFRTGEQRHIHREHDLTFIVHRGEGEIFIDDRRRVAHPGDVFHIPRGTPHYCVNRGPEPLVVVDVFTPPFDLKDSVPLPRESRSYPRDGAGPGQR